MTQPALFPVDSPPEDLPAGSGEFEYRMVLIPRLVTRSQAQRMLADLAEQGHWEIAVVRLYLGGARRVWLRRRIIRVVRTA
ncbi:MAG: DUF5703 family protein [Kineosporiaceae bacterium]|jgi:hypothetical protein